MKSYVTSKEPLYTVHIIFNAAYEQHHVYVANNQFDELRNDNFDKMIIGLWAITVALFRNR